jgi:class 3 adenylate cyclase
MNLAAEILPNRGTRTLARLLAEPLRPVAEPTHRVPGTTHAASERSHNPVTLLSSDIADFTRLTERLGDRDAYRVVQEHHAIVRDLAARHRGPELELRGDGFLLAFSTPCAAVACAIALQRAFERRNRRLCGERLEIRIGVHTGCVIRDADRVFGGDVIKAFRIADLAKPGEILVSGALAESVCSARSTHLQQVGDTALKGFSGRHRLFRVCWDAPGPRE